MLGEDGRPKTGRSKRDVIVHAGLEAVLRAHMPPRRAPDDFVFTTRAGAPIDEANFQGRVWLRALRALCIRPRPFYNCRHTYMLLVVLATFILSQTTESGTSTWFEGVLLLAVYAISAAAAYCVP